MSFYILHKNSFFFIFLISALTTIPAWGQETPTTPSPKTEIPAPDSEPTPKPEENLGVVTVPPPLLQCESRHECAANEALLEQLLAALNPGDFKLRLQKVKAFPSTTDARLLTALSYIALNDNNSSVGRAAIDSIATMETPKRYEALQTVVSHAYETIRTHCLETLGSMQSQDAATTLLALARDKSIPTSTSRLALETLREHYPDFAATQQLPKISGSMFLPIAGGVFFGGYTMSTVGLWSQSDGGPVVGAITGGLLGGTAGFLLAPSLSTPRSFFYVSAMTWGLWTGLRLNDSLFRTVDDASARRFGTLGQIGFLGAAYATADALDLDNGDLFVTNLSAIAAGTLATGLLGFADPTFDKRPGYATLTGATLAGLGLGIWGADSLKFSSGDSALSALGTIEGIWYGAWLTNYFDNPKQRIVPGTLVGASLGFLGASAWAQYSDYSVGQVLAMEMGSIYGKVFGTGLALLSQTNGQNINASQMLGGAIGIGASALMTPKLKYNGGDIALVPTATVLGLWHGGMLGVYLDEIGVFQDAQGLGFALTLASASGLGGIVAGQFTEFGALDVPMGAIGTVWGAWFAGMGLALLDDIKLENAILSVLLASDLGMAITSTLISDIGKIDPMVIAGASIGGIGLTGVVFLLSSMATDDDDSLTQVAIGSSAAGLVLGGVVTQLLIDMKQVNPANPEPTAQSNSADSPIQLLGIAPQPHLDESGKLNGMMMNLVFDWK